MTIERLWNHLRVPVVSNNLIAQKIITQSLNEEVSQAAIDTFVAYSKTHHETVDNANNSNKGRRKKRSARRSTIQISSSDSSCPDTVVLGAKSGLTINDYFFEHQRVHGYTNGTPILSQSAAMQTLHEALTAQVQTYLKHLGGKAATLCPLIQNGILSLDLWAAIQQGKGAYHKDHVHDGVLVSGVYYAKVPEGSAPLVLHKPILHPDGSYGYDEENQSKSSDNGDAIIVKPEEGQVFLFPPWLLHGVPRADDLLYGKEQVMSPRISFAFNLSGPYAAGDPWSITQDTQ